MKNYADYGPEDFLQDEGFIQWVKHPNANPDLDAFWEKWLQTHPHKREEVEEAKLLILSIIKDTQYYPDEATQAALWERIDHTTGKEPFAGNRSAGNKAGGRQLHYYVWRAAAAVLLLIIPFAIYYYQANVSAPLETTYAGRPAQNTAGKPDEKLVLLDDGTKVMLQPGSTIDVLGKYGENSREVRLVGEAFFDVVKNPEKPFIVYTNDITTRVLGTSFTVRSYAGEKNSTVKVKTGSVSVYKNKPARQATKSAADAVVLTPNQQVVYARAESKLSKTLVEDPQALETISTTEFEFTDTSVKDVFSLIEQKYGVEIVFDEQALAGCHINASLSELPLYSKIKIICKAINASYEIIDTHIVIYSKGCDNTFNSN